MVQKLKQPGYWHFCGFVTKDAVLKTVGYKKTPLCEFSVNCGKKDNGDTIFINCKAWRALAGVFSELMKGDSFCGIGFEKVREYNGKTYVDIELEWGNSPMISAGCAPVGVSPDSAPLATPGAYDSVMQEIDDADGELPF